MNVANVAQVCDTTMLNKDILLAPKKTKKISLKY